MPTSDTPPSQEVLVEEATVSLLGSIDRAAARLMQARLADEPIKEHERHLRNLRTAARLVGVSNKRVHNAVVEGTQRGLR